jgi:chromosome segregation ATPase
MRSLAAALSANSARLATLEESQVAPLSSSMAANSSRVAALEAGLEELRAHLAQQQQDRQGSAADGCSAPEERLAALEASLAELQLSMAHMHGAAAGAALDESDSELRASTSARAVANAAAAASAAAGKQGSSGIALLEVQSELGELRARVADLSACLAGAGSGAVEETFLPFMETTSNCLQQHEQQLDTIQVRRREAV